MQCAAVGCANRTEETPPSSMGEFQIDPEAGYDY